MKYYRLRNSIKDTGGKFPQVYTGAGDFNVTSKNYIGNNDYFFKKLPYKPVLPELVLYKTAKVTDLISSSFTGVGDGLIVSDKLKEILEKYSEGYLQSFPVAIHHREDNYTNYWYLKPFAYSNDLINFSKSEIWETKFVLKIKRVEVQNEEEFEQKRLLLDLYHSLYIDKYAVYEDKIPDFFILRSISGGIGYFLTEKVKLEIEQAGCTGITFYEPNEEYL